MVRSVIIRTFFKLIFGTIIFAMLIGLMLMPVVLSLVGPPPVRSILTDSPDVNAVIDSKSEASGDDMDVEADMVSEQALEMQKAKASPK